MNRNNKNNNSKSIKYSNLVLGIRSTEKRKSRLLPPNILSTYTTTSYEKVINYLKDLKAYFDGTSLEIITENNNSNSNEDNKKKYIDKINFIMDVVTSQNLYEYSHQSEILKTEEGEEGDEMQSLIGFLNSYSNNGGRKDFKFPTSKVNNQLILNKKKLNLIGSIGDSDKITENLLLKKSYCSFQNVNNPEERDELMRKVTHDEDAKNNDYIFINNECLSKNVFEDNNENSDNNIKNDGLSIFESAMRKYSNTDNKDNNNKNDDNENSNKLDSNNYDSNQNRKPSFNKDFKVKVLAFKENSDSNKNTGNLKKNTVSLLTPDNKKSIDNNRESKLSSNQNIFYFNNSIYEVNEENNENIENEDNNNDNKEDDYEDADQTRLINYSDLANDNLNITNNNPLVINFPKITSYFDNKFMEGNNYILDKNFDLFKFSEKVGENIVLSTVVNFVFEKFDSIINFPIELNSVDNKDTNNLVFLASEKQTLSPLVDFTKLNSFSAFVREKYNSNPYHNQLHGTDVFQTMFHLLIHSPIIVWVKLKPLDVFACLASSLVHDIGHPGFNNNFMINSQSDLTYTYNDIHVLENFHAAEGFKILNNKNTNIINKLNENELKYFRKRFIQMILSTDPVSHSKILSVVKNKLTNSEVVNGSNLEKLVSPSRLYDDQQEILDFLISFCDTSHSCKSFEVTFNWTTRLMNEFWHQGDVEKELEIPVSFLCDRKDAFVGKGQIGFIQAIIMPGAKTLVNMCPSLNHFMNNLNENIIKWQEYLDTRDKDDKESKKLN